MRLIDAEKALELFRDNYANERLIRRGETHLDRLAEGFTEAAHIIKDILPTVDAVPVVRCRDCKCHDRKVWCPVAMSGFHEVGMPLPHEDDYCSYGERKEGTNGVHQD